MKEKNKWNFIKIKITFFTEDVKKIRQARMWEKIFSNIKASLNFFEKKIHIQNT